MGEISSTVAANLPDELQRTNYFHEAIQAMADSLLTSVKNDFVIKAGGGIGEDGLSWEPTKKWLEHGGLMLIDTKFMLESFRFEIHNDKIILKNDCEYAKYQLNQRLPWPGEIPRIWIDRMFAAAQPFLLKAVTEATSSIVKNSKKRVRQVRTK